MKNKLSILLSLMFIIVLSFVLASCDKKTLNKLENENVIVEGSFQKGVTLSVNNLKTTDEKYLSTIAKVTDKGLNMEKVTVYDIFLAKNDSKVQPDGKVKIIMPIPFESEKGYTTYHIKENVIEELETAVIDGKIVFETSSFSYFVVTSKITEDNQDGITALELDAHNAGFTYIDGKLADKTVVKISDEYKPNPDNVLVYGVTAEGNKYLTKDEDYVIDLGGLDFTKEGTYTITYTYKRDTSIKITLNIEIIDSQKVTALELDAHNAGFTYVDGKLADKTVVKMTDDYKPNPDNVLVYGVTAEENKYLTKDEDYVIDLGGLDFTKEGTYTITYTYKRDTSIKITLNIEIIDSQKVTALELDAHNAGFTYIDGKLADKTVVKMTDDYKPNPDNVLVYGVTAEENKYLTKDEDYVIDLGGLDFTKEGTYTITYTYKKDTSIKINLVIEVIKD